MGEQQEAFAGEGAITKTQRGSTSEGLRERAGHATTDATCGSASEKLGREERAGSCLLAFSRRRIAAAASAAAGVTVVEWATIARRMHVAIATLLQFVRLLLGDKVCVAVVVVYCV